VNVRSIAAEVKHVLGLCWPREAITQVLQNIGYRWGKSKFIPKKDLFTPFWVKRRARYAVQLAEAIELERNGSHVIVFTDETYFKSRESTEYTWYNPHSPESNTVPAGTASGTTTICLHAITRDGLLTAANYAVPPNDTYHPPPAAAADTKAAAMVGIRLAVAPASASASGSAAPTLPPLLLAGEPPTTVSEAPTALLHWNAKALPNDDYHAHLNHALYLMWLERRLIPAFRCKYPGKELILVLDNVAYHKKRGDSGVCASMSKVVAAQFLKEHLPLERSIKGVGSQSGQSFKRELWTINASEVTGRISGASQATVVAAAREWVELHPELCVTIVTETLRKLVHDQLIPLRQHSKGSFALFTVPYESESQPIEMVWARAKGFVRALHSAVRSDEQLLQHVTWSFHGAPLELREALGTAGVRHTAGIDSDLCRRCIEHSERFVNSWMARDPLISAICGGKPELSTFNAARRAKFWALLHSSDPYDTPTTLAVAAVAVTAAAAPDSAAAAKALSSAASASGSGLARK